MKKKLLWIWILSIWIISLIWLSFYFYKVSSIKKERNNQLIRFIQLNQLTEQELEWYFLSQEECYDENWNNDIRNFKFDEEDNLINCYNKEWREEGKRKTYYEGNYKNWKRDWIWIYYYKNWQIQSLHYYKNWKEQWIWIDYDEDWKKQAEYIFKIEWNVDIMQQKYYYRNWQLRSESFLKNWTIDGECFHYYEDGQVKEKMNYVNWKLNWEYISYNENWQVSEKCIYKNWERIQCEHY